MCVQRKYEGWGRKRHKWEEENRIVVAGVGKVSETEKQGIATCIRKLLDQFGLPFEVQVASNTSHLTRSMRDVLQSSLLLGRIDSDSALRQINTRREKDPSLRPAIVLKVNPSEYDFTDPKAIYGVGEPDGLVILRKAHEEAIIHEMGHMLGINSHCEKVTCVMKYECPSKNFCETCAAKLRGLWYYTEPE
jgi:hypothetical protein